jgi:hypothetical protein
MARINLETEFWDDPRLDLLEKQIASTERNCRHEARGCFLSAMRMAQKYWAPKNGKSEQLIPHDIWEAFGFQILIDVGLAEQREEGIYVKGSKENFKWLVERKRAGKIGGKNSGKSRSSNAEAKRSKREANAKQTPSKTKQTPSKTKQTRSKTNPLTLTLTPTLTLTKNNTASFSHENNQPKNCADKAVTAEKQKPTRDTSWDDLASRWLDFSTSMTPNGTSRYKTWNVQAFATHIKKAAEHLGRDREFMERVLAFIKADDFWSLNAISPEGLLKKSKNGLKKIDNIAPRVQCVSASTQENAGLDPIDMHDPYAYEREYREILPEKRKVVS